MNPRSPNSDLRSPAKLVRWPFLVGFAAALCIAAVSPTLPPTRLAPGTGITITTNGVNNFTIATSGSSGLGTNNLNANQFEAGTTNVNIKAGALQTNGFFYSSGTTNPAARFIGGTQTNSNPVEFLSTWNASGVTFTGLKLNVTNTASSGGSLLADYQVGGISKFKVDKDGLGTLGGGLNFTGNLTHSGNYFSINTAAGGVNLYGSLLYGGGVAMSLGKLDWSGPVETISQTASSVLKWAAGGVGNTTVDTALRRESANVFEFNSGTNGLEYRSTLLAAKYTARAGTSTSTYNAAGLIVVDTTQTGNVGVGVDTLQTNSIAANTLAANGDTLVIEADGTFANTGASKQIILNFGTTAILTLPTSTYGFSAASAWRIRAKIVRTGAATQKASAEIILNNSEGVLPYTFYTTPTNTLSGAVGLWLTGEATADNDIVKEICTVDFKPAP